MKTKYVPVLYYAFEACPLNKSEINSLDYVLFSTLSDIFHAKSKYFADGNRGLMLFCVLKEVKRSRSRVAASVYRIRIPDKYARIANGNTWWQTW